MALAKPVYNTRTPITEAIRAGATAPAIFNVHMHSLQIRVDRDATEPRPFHPRNNAIMPGIV